MRTILLACLIVCPAVEAQVLECAKFYTGNDDQAPALRSRKVADKARLVSAGVTVDDPNGGGDLHGDIQDVKGGWIAEYSVPSGPKFFVCTYGDRYNLRSWKQLDEKVSYCKLVVKDKNSKGMMEATITCK